MKTYNRLKNQIVAFDNLLLALKKARKGKKYGPGVDRANALKLE
ncbi:MAG: hypothetical protein SFV55_00905 [Haliscomenobacter sp.]|nr:hypothetical protein [Haliscomenobacter sp.]MDX2066946.1 hypothetical protein [Haliscomenobacter sp.]